MSVLLGGDYDGTKPICMEKGTASFESISLGLRVTGPRHRYKPREESRGLWLATPGPPVPSQAVCNWPETAGFTESIVTDS